MKYADDLGESGVGVELDFAVCFHHAARRFSLGLGTQPKGCKS
jgi:hypothetical protein